MVVAELVAVSIRPERDLSDHDLIAICQRMLCANSAKALTSQERRNADRAFAELLTRYNQWIWKQIHARPKLDSHSAYSAALEGFQKAIASFDLCTGHALATLAYHYVRHALQGVLRKEQRQAAKVELVAANSAGVYEDDCLDLFEQEQLYQSVQRLDQAIASLGEATQQIISMRGEGMRYAEIGVMLDKSADAVRMAHSRAVLSLQSILEKQTEFSFSALAPRC